MKPNQFFSNGMISTNGPFHMEQRSRLPDWAINLIAFAITIVLIGGITALAYFQIRPVNH